MATSFFIIIGHWCFWMGENNCEKMKRDEIREKYRLLLLLLLLDESVYKGERGLGQNGDGVESLVEFKENRGRFGLGYKPTRPDVRRRRNHP